ncbi:unnamed protein product, partial [Arctogadus glacialis]
PESEVSTTADDYSSEEEVDALHLMTKEAKMDDMEDELAAKTQAVEELSRELEEIRACFGSEGIHQLQDFEAALKQRDGIITQLTSNLQQARDEKEDIMREFLQMTEQSQKLHIQFQQLQAGETLRNTTHSSTAADLLQARQQMVQYQQQLEDLGAQVRSREEHLLGVSDLEHKLSQMETAGRRSEETFAQKLSEKASLIAEQEHLISGQEQSLADLKAQLALSSRASEESFAHSLGDKDLLISKQNAIISEHERSLSLLRDELTQAARSGSPTDAQSQKEKDARIAEQARVVSEQERFLAHLEEQLKSSEKLLNELCLVKDQALESCQGELESTRVDLERCKSGWDDSKVELENGVRELERCKDQLLNFTVEMEKGQTELKSSKDEFANSKLEFEKRIIDLESYKKELENSKSELQTELKSSRDESQDSKSALEKGTRELESCKEELAASRQKERTSSGEVMQLMGTVEDLQRRCHQGSLSEGDVVQRMEEESLRTLERLRAELDEMYGQQIVQMKQELQLQHAAAVEQLSRQHGAELDALSAQEERRRSDVDERDAKLADLQETLQGSQAAHGRAQDELHGLAQEKLGLQAQVEDLLRDLRQAQDVADKASHNLTLSKGSRQTELQHLQRISDGLRCQLEAAEEAALEVEAKHESEVTNYKIKLEMLEREKDAVLDRMAQSQEAELERLRTQLLFSHEEELILLREDLRRESFLNTENLLNEASVRRERALEELRATYEEKLGSLGRETAVFATERAELLEQILALKGDLKAAQSSSRAEELVQQLQELQAEVVELRQGAEQRGKVEREYKALLTKVETLENEAREKEDGWRSKLEEKESEKRMLNESNTVLKKAIDLATETVQSLTLESNQKVQELAELRDEIEKQRTTYSFAERNFEVNFQELKGEYTCLIQAKTQLEERTLKETLEFEAKIASLQSQVREQEEGEEEEEESGGRVKRGGRGDRATAPMERDTTELMEKLNAISNEKGSLIARLSDVTDKLSFSEGKLERLKGELLEIHQEHGKVLALNKSLAVGLERERDAATDAKKDGEPRRRYKPQHRASAPAEPDASAAHQRRVESLQGEVESLRSRLQAAEAERAPPAPNRLLPLQTASPAATSGDGHPPPQKPPAAPVAPAAPASGLGSNRRKRRQRVKQERKATHTTAAALADGSSSSSVSREERQRGEEEAEMEEEEVEEEEQQQQELSLAAAELGRAAEPAVGAGMQSEAASRSTQRLGGEEDSADRCQGDAETSITKPVGSRAAVPGERAVGKRESSTAQHAECRLQLEAQRVSLSQIHAAQLELLAEQTSAHTSSLETGPGGPRDRAGQDLAAQRPAPMSHWEETEREVGEVEPEREEARRQRLLLEESHREELQRLHSHYTQLASDAEERHATQLVVLEQRLHLLTSTHSTTTRLSVQSVSSSEIPEQHDEIIQFLLSEHQPGTELGAEPESGTESESVRSSGLTAQLQALRRALCHKHLQEVASLKGEHHSELRRLREERAEELGRGQRERGGGDAGGGGGRPGSAPGEGAGEAAAGGRTLQEEKRYWESVEEEVAKVIVQMSVEFAQQSELARISKQGLQISSSMQTQPEEEVEVEVEEERETPRSGPRVLDTSSIQTRPKIEKKKKKKKKEVMEERGTSSLKEVEGCGKLETEVRELTSEVVRLKEQLRNAAWAVKKTVKKKKEKEEEEEDGEEMGKPGGGDIATLESSGLEEVTSERNLLREHNYRLHQVLQDVLKTTAAAEETMGLHVESLRLASAADSPPPPPSGAGLRSEASLGRLHTKPFSLCSAGSAADSFQGSESSADESSIAWSGVAEADGGPGGTVAPDDPALLSTGVLSLLEDQESLLGASSRLQRALERMLVAIAESSDQLEHARVTQTELMRESFRHNQEVGELLQRQEELQERLAEEARAREQLALELHRAEGVIEGYSGERTLLEEQARQKEELQLSLEQELQVTASRLNELEQERLLMHQEKELLGRQQDAMRETAGPRELHLLEETEKLMKEKVEVQRQAEKDSSDLGKQVKQLEAELEEQVNRSIELEQAQRNEGRDLRQQVQSLEKQMENNRKFLAEQAVDREHERDVFQQEIQKLEEQLRNPQKLQGASDPRGKEVERLSSQLQQKADWCSELLLGSEQRQRELDDRDQEIDTLEGRVRELEQALLASAESLGKDEERKQHDAASEARHNTLEAQLQTEREALDRKEKEISHLEEQLEQFREELENKSEEAQQLQMQLEIQEKELGSQQEHLETRESMLQDLDQREDLIRDLESQVECLRSEQERLKRNGEVELEQLNAVIDKLQQELANIEQKLPPHHDEEEEEELDTQARVRGGDFVAATGDELGQTQRRLDVATGELGALRGKHGELFETYRRLKETSAALAETEEQGRAEEEERSEARLEDALRETASLVVMQAQVQALEQSASSRVDELRRRVEDLERAAEEKEAELARGRLLAETLRGKVDHLEDRLRETETDASALTGQAQHRDSLQGEPRGQTDPKRTEVEESQPQGPRSDAPPTHVFPDFGLPQLDSSSFSMVGGARGPAGGSGRAGRLTEKLRELEVGLSGMQKDQELQKQLLSSSEEEVMEYERRLAVLMDLLTQMRSKAGAHHKTWKPTSEPSPAADQRDAREAHRELQEVRDEALATKEQLDHYKQSSSQHEEQLAHNEQRHGQLRAELDDYKKSSGQLEGQLADYEQRCSKLMEELDNYKQSSSQLKQEQGDLKASSSQLQEQLNVSKESSRQLEEQLADFKQTTSKLQEELENYTQSSTQLQEQVDQYKQSSSQLEEQLADYKQNSRKLEAQLEVYKQSSSKLQEQQDTSKQNCSQLEEQIANFKKSSSQLQEQVDQYKQSSSQLQEQVDQYKQSSSQLQEQVDQYKQSSSQLQEQVDRYKQSSSQLEVQLADSKQSCSQLQQELEYNKQSSSELRQQQDDSKQNSSQLEKQLEELEQSSSQLQQELDDSRKNSSQLENKLADYKQSSSQLQQELADSKRNSSQLEVQLEEYKQSSSELEVQLADSKQNSSQLQKELENNKQSSSELQQQQDDSRQNSSQLEEQIAEYKQSSSRLQQELDDSKQNTSQLQGQLEDYKQSLSKLQEQVDQYKQSSSQLQQELEASKQNSSQLEEQLEDQKQSSRQLQQELEASKQNRSQLEEQLEDQKQSSRQLQQELEASKQNRSQLEEQLEDQKQSSSQLQQELDTAKQSCSQLEEQLEDQKQSSSQLQKQLDDNKQSSSQIQEELNDSKRSYSKLQEQLEEKTLAISRVEEQMQKASPGVGEEAVQQGLDLQLQEVQKEVVVVKDELDSCKQSSDRLQELLQEREMTIAHLKGELYRATASAEGEGEEGGSSVPGLLQQLQEVQTQAAATKEEVASYRQRADQLQDELGSRDLAIAQLKDELRELQAASAAASLSPEPPSPSPTSPSPSPQPPPSSSSSSSTTAVAAAGSQPKRKAGKSLSGKGSGSAKDKASLSRKNSAAAAQQASEKTQSPGGPGAERQPQQEQRRQVSVADSSTQTHQDLQTTTTKPTGVGAGTLSPSAAAQTKQKEEEEEEEVVAEVIGEFQEKIVQMQELHAAEILDMEARHIAESEGLRLDTLALENECKALKAVVDKLRSGEASSARTDRPASLQFRDGYTSDSSSDYSQRTGYDPPSLQQEFRTTPEGARRDGEDPLPDKIKTLLREVHQEGMQVLSLSEFPLTEDQAGGSGGPGWGQTPSPGWPRERQALLDTVQSLKTLVTQMQTSRGTQTPGGADWRGELLGAVQRVLMGERGVLKSALYSQLDQLDSSDAIVHLNQLEQRLAQQEVHHREAMGSLQTADRSSLLSEVQQLRATMEQLHPGVQPASSPGPEAEGGAQRGSVGPGSGAPGDRVLLEELKGELSQTKLELETTLKAQHKHLKELDALRKEVSERAAELEALTDQLSEERRRTRELQWVLEKERNHTGRSEESQQEELEDLRVSAEEQRSRAAQLASSLEEERRASSQRSLQAQQAQLALQSRLQELQVRLDTQQATAREMSSALGRERQLRTGAGGAEQEEEEEEEVGGERSVLKRLQRDLDEKHAQVVRLLGELEAQRLEAVRQQEEVQRGGQRAQRDQEALEEARGQLALLEQRAGDAQQQLEREAQRRRGLEQEKEALEERLAEVGQRLAGGAGGAATRSHDPQDPARDTPAERTTDRLHHPETSTTTTTTTTHGHAGPGPYSDGTGGVQPGPPGAWRSGDHILGKLSLTASKIRAMAGRNTDSLTTEVEKEELSWIQTNLDEVLSMLQQSPGLSVLSEHQSLAPMAGSSLGSSSSNFLSERLLRQNAELTGFVSRLTEEKSDLRNQTLRLEDELRRHRHAGALSADTTGTRSAPTRSDWAVSSALLSQEREAWSRERSRLEKALQQAQAQAGRLRGEVRSEALSDVTGPDLDNAALKRIYGKYLRSESFRKALVYQKKYLLLLLGGFQECEEATLALITRMGGRPAICGPDSVALRSRRGLTRFRSAVRVSIALSRMRFLVRRWHKATGVRSPSPSSGAGKTHAIGMEVKAFLHPGSVEVYRERGGERGGGGGGSTSSRGRSGRDSPRSAISNTTHRYHVGGDGGSLTCSHLLNYDPDRALTDYISRLEALQRRLGSVTSGSSSYAPLHFGLRR